MDPSRRRFLKTLTMSSSAFLIAPTLLHADDAPPAAAKWVVIGPAAHYAKGKTVSASLPASAGGSTIFITHQADNTFLALSARCTHRGCLVDWDQSATAYVCPCHNGRFDPQGKVLAGPPRRPLPSYPTRVNADKTLSVQVGA